MSTPAANREAEMHLRRLAEDRLRVGSAPRARIATTGAEALALLHRMATDTGKASDVLKLLHELQVHQVELDLQHEQLEQTQDELSHALDRYVERFDFAPLGYLALERDGRIIEGNLAAAELCGVPQAALSGRHIDSLVSPHSRLALLAMLKRLGGAGSRETCAAQVDCGGQPRQCQVVASVSPGAQSVMMLVVETTDFEVPGRSA